MSAPMRWALLLAAERMVEGSLLLRGDGLAEAEVPRQHRDAAGQLTGAETDQLLDERSAGTQPLRSARFDVVRRTGKHCGERHSLSDDHQPDDQYEKPFAETTHETDSNARADIVGAARLWPRESDCRNETFRTPNRIYPGIDPGPRSRPACRLRTDTARRLSCWPAC